ncbi:MAG: hypothetical protein ABIT37_09820, partial [Luteolibacter sp.]
MISFHENHLKGVFFGAVMIAIGSSGRLEAQNVLPDIPRGTIALELTPVATGLSAPDYAISPPGDGSRLFVLEQKGLVLIIKNGTLLPAP